MRAWKWIVAFAAPIILGDEPAHSLSEGYRDFTLVRCVSDQTGCAGRGHDIERFISVPVVIDAHGFVGDTHIDPWHKEIVVLASDIYAMPDCVGFFTWEEDRCSREALYGGFDQFEQDISKLTHVVGWISGWFRYYSNLSGGRFADVFRAQVNGAIKTTVFDMPRLPRFCVQPKPGPVLCDDSLSGDSVGFSSLRNSGSVRLQRLVHQNNGSNAYAGGGDRENRHDPLRESVARREQAPVHRLGNWLPIVVFSLYLLGVWGSYRLTMRLADPHDKDNSRKHRK